MVKPLYDLNGKIKVFQKKQNKNFFRYVCEEEFLETLNDKKIRLKNPNVWKKDYPDEFYFKDWILDVKNIPFWLDIVYKENRVLIDILEKNKQKPSFTNMNYYLAERICRIFDIVLICESNYYAICYTKNAYKKSMWGNYAKNDRYVCYEVTKDYFSNFVDTKKTFEGLAIAYKPSFDLMDMHYCEPSELIKGALSDGLGINDNLDKAFYLKHKKLRSEDEVRLNYCHRPNDELLESYLFDKREELKKRIIESKTDQDINDTLIDFLSKFADNYQEFKKGLIGKIEAYNFEDQIYYVLPSKINEYIVSVKMAPNAPSDYIKKIIDICEKYGINNVS